MTRPFPTLPAELNSRISAIIRANPSAHQVFADLIAHFDPALQPLASKKHKLDSHIENILVKLANVSAIYPVRKKVDLVLTQNDLNMALSLIAAYTLDYNNIGIILQFNTPNKQKEHWTVCCIPEGASGQLNDNIAVFGWDASAKLAIEMGDANKPKQNTHERFMSVFARLVFARSGVVPVTSVILPPAVIDCYHRAKDGHLFISPHGLFFGLKKPFFYFPHNGSQVSIMGVTGRTFNIVVEHGDTSVEFSMIDSKQYNVIAAYIETLSAVNKIKNEDIALGDGSESDDEDYVSGAESTVLNF